MQSSGKDVPKFIVLHPDDNVAVALTDLPEGEPLGSTDVVARTAVPAGHKISLRAIAAGDRIVKYGQSIGSASRPIEAGAHVHVNNVEIVRTGRSSAPVNSARDAGLKPAGGTRYFNGFRRADGSAGTRNYLGILSTVSCSADVSDFIAKAITDRLLPDYPEVDGVVAVTHGSGCCHAPDSEGLEILQRTLHGYACNPNFGGVLIVGLGCETNLVSSLLRRTALVENNLLQTISIQECGGTRVTVEAGVAAAARMLPLLASAKRQALSCRHLKVALECGGSDAYSGITANPALGEAVDLLIKCGGTAILSETPEIYGAEHLLTARAQSPEISARLLERVKWWERYTANHGAQLNNNPTPGNKAGGISTIMEKSMGAVAKGGTSELVEVHLYGERVIGPGLVFMDTPGYDVVSITGMIAGGANLVCFTTGRGTVAGFKPVPTLKLASNTAMFEHLGEDMDINCGRVLDGRSDLPLMGREIFEEMIATASGKRTRSEILGFGGSEFVPWQMGAIL